MRAARAFIVWLFIGAVAIGCLMRLSEFLSLGGSDGHRAMRKRTDCAANMNAIAKGVLLYAGGNRDMYPPNAVAIVMDGSSHRLFVCPSTGNEEAELRLERLLRENDRGKLAQQFPACSDYIYIRGHTGDSQPNEVVFFELPANHGCEIANVLYMDGHVASQRPPAELIEALRQTNDAFALRRGSQP